MYFRTLTGFALLALLGCSSKVQPPKPLYAVLRFENLTGNPALDWIGRAASETLSTSLSTAMDGIVLTPSSLARLGKALGPRPGNVPGSSAQRQEAILAGANHLISGYAEMVGGAVRFHAVDENLTTGKIVQSTVGSGVQPMAALSALARNISPTAKPYATLLPEALRLYAEALDSAPSDAKPLLGKVLGLDPEFGAAWVLLAGVEAGLGDAQGAAATIREARTHRLTALDKANLDVTTASLAGDAKAKLSALKQVTQLNPGDTTLLRAVAESEVATGDFAAAATDWARLAELVPADVDAWNQLGYTRAWGGNYAGAITALAEYAKLRPADANPLDSTGDVHFMNRKYASAAQSYMAAHSKSPGFERFADLYKAAWAKFRAGDKAGADKTFAEFRVGRGKISPQGVELAEADWLYRTGRKAQAEALLRARIADPASAAVAPNAYSQLAVWELIDGDRAGAARDALAAGQPRTPVMAIIRIATMPSAPAAEWAARVEKMLPGPSLAGVRRLALGYALLLDGKKSDAIPVWEDISKAASAGDFPLHALRDSLKGVPTKLALVPNPDAINQFAALYGDL